MKFKLSGFGSLFLLCSEVLLIKILLMSLSRLFALNITFKRHIHFSTAKCCLFVTNSKVSWSQCSLSGTGYYTDILAPEYWIYLDQRQTSTPDSKKQCKEKHDSALSQLRSSGLINLDSTPQKLGSSSSELILEAAQPQSQSLGQGIRSCQHQAGST